MYCSVTLGPETADKDSSISSKAPGSTSSNATNPSDTNAQGDG